MKKLLQLIGLSTVGLGLLVLVYWVIFEFLPSYSQSTQAPLLG